MVQLNPNTVGAMIQIIDVAASKGVFSGVDITSVGQIRSELVEVLRPLQEEAAAQAEAEEVEASVDGE